MERNNKRVVSISINEQLWKQFRIKIAREVGLDKGSISETVEFLIASYVSSHK